MEDQRARYLQSMRMSPSFQSYSDNIDVGSPLDRYVFAGSPMSGKVALPYYDNSSGNRSFSSRGRLSLSPLSSIENFEIAPRMYGTPLKMEEEVLVMDDILVKSTTGGKNGKSSSSSSGRGSLPLPWLKGAFKTEVCKARDESGNRRYNSKCQFADGKKELYQSRLSMMSISEAQTYKSSLSAGSCQYGSNSCTVDQHHAAADSAVTTSQPEASPVKPSIVNSSNFKDWSPVDDGIEVVLPGSDKSPSREEVEAYISSLLNGPVAKRRLPVFEILCEGQ